MVILPIPGVGASLVEGGKLGAKENEGISGVVGRYDGIAVDIVDGESDRVGKVEGRKLGAKEKDGRYDGIAVGIVDGESDHVGNVVGDCDHHGQARSEDKSRQHSHFTSSQSILIKGLESIEQNMFGIDPVKLLS
eukprot:CAMPEP_0178920488 /NCGR_PEP_ID=MMETSP0786-20121207/15033_1 /TAXON_ID=186022 /ORGANISM="Thalassionema frauenfeldii, Strain CCMP 1798" /LENGTH=134 /DNA_ID=CAMNT_0020594561 /DNA_START=313 /DNA_END=718 /DNA_ORIENTATION=-